MKEPEMELLDPELLESRNAPVACIENEEEIAGCNWIFELIARIFT